jgi:hypothetical protein
MTDNSQIRIINLNSLIMKFLVEFV